MRMTAQFCLQRVRGFQARWLGAFALFFIVSGAEAQSQPAWSAYVQRSLDTLIERGTDRYGDVHSPLLMAVIDLETLDSPERPERYDSLIRLEGRIHRRGERGSNLWADQPTCRAMYALSKLSGDEKYARAADAYAAYVLDHCRDEKGLPSWGSHVHWDCYRDQPGGDGDGAGPHEILIHDANWEAMHRLNPQAVREIADAIWNWHVHDKEHGRHNRHDDNSVGREFSFSGSSFIDVFAFMYQVTGEQQYLEKAKLVANWHFSHRDPKTGLPAELPGLANDKDGLYGRTFMTTLSGPHAAALLRAYRRTGDRYFYDVAATYLKAYDEYGWDESAGTYLGMLNLDGTATSIDDVPESMRSQVVGYGTAEPDPGYSVPPIGPVELWQTTIFPLEFPLESAKTALFAYEISTGEGAGKGDSDFLRSAQRWAGVIEGQLPPQTGRAFRRSLKEIFPELSASSGTYASSYGHAISFFVHLYRATDDRHYLEIAQSIGQSAVDKLYQETALVDDAGNLRTYALFRGHASKPYYESVDGVGVLLHALLELDHPDDDLGWAY